MLVMGQVFKFQTSTPSIEIPSLSFNFMLSLASFILFLIYFWFLWNFVYFSTEMKNTTQHPGTLKRSNQPLGEYVLDPSLVFVCGWVWKGLKIELFLCQKKKSWFDEKLKHIMLPLTYIYLGWRLEIQKNWKNFQKFKNMGKIS